MDEKVYLISSAEEGSICIVTLMLTGRATPNLHNGIVNIGDEQHYVSYCLVNIIRPSLSIKLNYLNILNTNLFIFRPSHITEYWPEVKWDYWFITKKPLHQYKSHRYRVLG